MRRRRVRQEQIAFNRKDRKEKPRRTQRKASAHLHYVARASGVGSRNQQQRREDRRDYTSHEDPRKRSHIVPD
jgi:hypothetical protein